MMICNECGECIPEISVFCPKCGAFQNEEKSDYKEKVTEKKIIKRNEEQNRIAIQTNILKSGRDKEKQNDIELVQSDNLKKYIIIIGILVLLFVSIICIYFYSDSSHEENYILENSDSHYYSEKELENYDLEKLGYARNEIFARHGMIFSEDGKYQQYFENQSWYEGKIDKDNFDDSVLNDYELKNIQTIKIVENEKKNLDSRVIDNYINFENDDSEDYYSINSPEDFTIFNGNNYRFAYPSNFYYSGYSNDTEAFFQGDNGSELAYSFKENEFASVETAYEETYDFIRTNFDITDRIIDNPEEGRMVFSGVSLESADKKYNYYYLAKITKKNICTMEIIYPISDDEKETLHQFYVVDCLYRYCSFNGGSKHTPRSYQEFVESGEY